jgi:hypothetical protein
MSTGEQILFEVQQHEKVKISNKWATSLKKLKIISLLLAIGG